MTQLFATVLRRPMRLETTNPEHLSLSLLVSAHGVDYPCVTHVIQIGIPAGMDQYIHRVGRTGRAGTQGGPS
jgi:superfamily II DNA/RNA helicase